MRTGEEWRAWLAGHGRSEAEVWLVVRRKHATGLKYGEAVEHALCYGWVDSRARRRDEDSYILRFTPRRHGSMWSALNRERATRMAERGLMTGAGQALVDRARADGTWDALEGPDGLGVPDDLQRELDRHGAAAGNFAAFPPSSRRQALAWVAAAKKPETRRRRIRRAVELAGDNVRANHPGSRSA